MEAHSSSPAARTSRPSFISGEFEIVRYASFLAKEYPKALANAIDAAVREETVALQEAARNSNSAWVGLTGKLNVSYNEDNGLLEYGVSNDDETSRQATDLEYGVTTEPPKPLLRSFVKSREEQFGNVISTKVAQTLNGKYK